MHGGGAPQVKANARLRLAAMVDPALDIVLRALKPKNQHTVKFPEQLRAAWDVLDRNGYRSKEEVVLTQSLEVTQFHQLPEADLERLVRMLRQISIPVDRQEHVTIDVKALTDGSES